jgi:CheY-like chemotaxis protein
MAKILLIDKDEANLKLMKDAIALTGTEEEAAALQSEIVHVFIIPPPLKPEEVPKGKTPDPLDYVFHALNTTQYDFIFMEAAQIVGQPAKYVEEFRRKIRFEANKNIPIVLLSYNDDIDFVRKMTINGLFLDYLLKPADAANFRQKFSLLVSKTATFKQELYSMPTSQPVNVAYNFIIEEISEFGLLLHSNRPYHPGEYVTFYSPVFKTEKQTEVIGRCYKAEKLKDGGYKCKFVFVGVGEIVRKQIRMWMKLEYVRKKQAA